MGEAVCCPGDGRRDRLEDVAKVQSWRDWEKEA